MSGDSRHPPGRWPYESALPELAWPAIPRSEACHVLALLFQLEQTQWLPPGDLLARQLEQLARLTRHAFLHSPYYRARWAGCFDPEGELSLAAFRALPLLERVAVQTHYEEILSAQSPPAHGKAEMSRTSGSTGMPVRFLRNGLTQLFWNAFTLRDHLWQRRDLRGKLAAIRRHGVPARAANWGIATAGVLQTGEAVALALRGPHTDVEAQLEWLLRERPDYLLTYPSNAAELARTSLAKGIRLPGLREIRTLGEPVTGEMRELCEQAWNARIVDVYSSEEAGYIALQCPSGTHYHLQSEGLFIEILDEAGAPCAPGETGRVFVTTLHNFSFPLIRYDLGDYAEPGEACACGRGLPVLRRVAGRVRNMLLAPDGTRHWPGFGTRFIAQIAPIRQFQFAQTERDLIEARLVLSAPMSTVQKETLRAHLLASFPPGFRIRFVYVDEIARSAGGKFEDFVNLLPASVR